MRAKLISRIARLLTWTLKGARFPSVAIRILAVLSLVSACYGAALRRPLSPQTPMFLFQVQQPDASDPQACINAVPADLRPYTVFMYCMGAQTGTQTNGFAFADYFCNVAQQNGVWCMFQCASGYANTLANTNTADYQVLLQKYPNLIGFAFAEQNWGFVSVSSAFGPSSFADRLELFANLLPLCSQYGAYLYSSEMQSYGGNKGFNMMAKLKSSPNFRNATVTYLTNFIVGDKTTQGSGYYDNESCTLGTFLSGHAGYYAARFDETAWGSSGRSELYGLKPGYGGADPGFTTPEPAHGIFIAEHFLLHGATVLDGPEFPMFSTINQGRLMPCYKNMTADLFRKVLDGSVKIPAISEVRARTPIVYVCDAVSGQTHELTGDVYDGLYMMDGDGTNNTTWLKSSGRYSSIPETYTNAAYELSFFRTNVLQTQISNRWPTLAAKTNEFNAYFPAEYATTNVFFAARRENRWLTYNPYVNSNVTTSATLALQYNTCSNLYLQYPAQTFGVIVESNQTLQIYLNNYLTDKDVLWATHNNNTTAYIQNTFISNPPDNTTNTIRTTVMQVSGCTNVPSYSLIERGSHPATTVSTTFVNGVFTVNLTGNGPCDLTLNCSGGAIRTNSVPGPAVLVPPASYSPGVPAAPVGLVASPGQAQATLTWHATNCLYYNIKRGAFASGPFTTVATGVTNSVNLYSSFIGGATVYNTALSYTDTSVTVSNTYYYVVSGVNVSGEGPNSAPAIVTIIPISSVTNLPLADAYVESSNPNVNFGTSTNLLVKNNITLATRNAYLMFDVHGLAGVRSASLTFVPNRVDDTTVPIYYELAPTNWTENGITWNNQPGGTGLFLATNTVRAGVPVVLEAATIVARQATNGGLLSLRITQPTNTLNGLIQFSSKEFPTSSWRPTLQYSVAAPFGLAPTGLVAFAASWNQVNLSWAAASGATCYNLRRAVTPSGPYSLLTQGLTTTSFSDMTAFSDTSFYYAVAAVYAGGESTNSSEASTTTPFLPSPSTLAANVANQISLSWPAAAGASSYSVMRSYVSGGPYTVIRTGLTNTSCNDTVFFTGATYYYVVVAVDAGGQSPNSPEASVTPSTLGLEPTDDANVEDGSSAASNFGDMATLKVKNQGPNTTFTRITYLKFNVQPLTNAQSVKLKLTPYQVDGSAVTNAFELLTDDSWTETAITWNNQPVASGVIITNVPGSTWVAGAPSLVDVTPWVLGQATNDGVVSFRITDPNTNAILIGFASKEYPASGFHPVLQFVNPGNNTPPTLAPVANRIIGPGQMLIITNSASDTDSPPQTLTFRLTSAPTNAGIGLASGVLNWRPLTSQASTTNQFTVMVTDSGSPNRTATQSFFVSVTALVRPVVSMPGISGNTMTLNVTGPAGPDYQIQASTNLANWTAVFMTNSPVMPFAWTNSVSGGASMNFFRVLVGPPF
jgi:fibronectin type 3 domain-containing protein